MGLARKKSAQKHQPVKPVNTGGSVAQALPNCVQVEFLFVRSDLPTLLVNHIDNVQCATYSIADGQLDLQCHFLVLFGDASISGFRLIRSKAGLDTIELSALDTNAINSPGVGSQHPDLAWATSSRFVVSSKVSAPGLAPGDLVTIAAQVGDQLHPISRMYITGLAARVAEEAVS